MTVGVKRQDALDVVRAHPELFLLSAGANQISLAKPTKSKNNAHPNGHDYPNYDRYADAYYRDESPDDYEQYY